MSGFMIKSSNISFKENDLNGELIPNVTKAVIIMEEKSVIPVVLISRVECDKDGRIVIPDPETGRVYNIVEEKYFLLNIRIDNDGKYIFIVKKVADAVKKGDQYE